MTSVRFKWIRSSMGGTSVEGLDGLGSELSHLAEIGLTTTGINKHLGALPICLQLVSGKNKALQLIDLINDGCIRLTSTNKRYGDVATDLFGSRPGERGRPYSSRLATAAGSWQENLAPASFNRRHRAKVLRELQQAVLELLQDATGATFRRWLELDVSLLPLPHHQNKSNLSFKRLHFNAITYIEGSDRRPSHTDWTYHDIATVGDVDQFRIFTKEDDARVEITARSDNIQVDRPLGVDPGGYQVWLIRFKKPPQRREEVEWSVRKTFHRSASPPIPFGWISLAASQPQSIESGTMEVNTKGAKVAPMRFTGFVTPKQTLPELRGTSWPVVPVNGRATVSFDQLVPWHSHGTSWFWRAE